MAHRSLEFGLRAGSVRRLYGGCERESLRERREKQVNGHRGHLLRKIASRYRGRLQGFSRLLCPTL